MYKSFTANDYRKFFGLPDNYKIDGLLAYGTFRKKLVSEQLKNSFRRHTGSFKITHLEHEYLEPIYSIETEGKIYWFVTVYGGAWLSERLHLASLLGSKKNILLGSCGGLKKGATSLEIIIPKWSFANESSAKAYQPEANCKYKANEELSKRLADKLAKKHKIHRGATITYQAMMAETWEDIQNWSKQGYVGVEMEAATVFAVSKHFNVPAAAMLRIGDNLIEKETVIGINYEKSYDLRKQVSQDIMDTAIEELLAPPARS